MIRLTVLAVGAVLLLGGCVVVPDYSTASYSGTYSDNSYDGTYTGYQPEPTYPVYGSGAALSFSFGGGSYYDNGGYYRGRGYEGRPHEERHGQFNRQNDTPRPQQNPGQNGRPTQLNAPAGLLGVPNRGAAPAEQTQHRGPDGQVPFRRPLENR